MTNAVVENAKQDAKSGELTRDRKVFQPRADVYETADTIVVLADMPGVDEHSIDITIEKNVLTIHGYTTSQAPEGLRLVYRECPDGDFRRVFLLSEEVDREGIKASVKNGVLKLVLPKSPIAKARKITVKAE